MSAYFKSHYFPAKEKTERNAKTTTVPAMKDTDYFRYHYFSGESHYFPEKGEYFKSHYFPQEGE